MKVLVFLAKGFETMEFSVFVDVMGWARNDYGHDIDVVTCGFKKQVMSTFNIPVLVDKTIEEVCVDDYDALAIPGGFEEFGFYGEAYDASFLNLIRETYHLKNGKRQRQLSEFDVNVVNEPIVVDKNIITSYCPETAPYVAFKLLEMLTSKEQMDEVKLAMGFKL
ncbi:TPA: DJ-1/PfpI family protein [Clostridioides difficile]